MGMANWGFSGLTLDMTKAKEAAPLEWENLKRAIEEAEDDINYGYALATQDLPKNIIKLQEEFMNKILMTMEVEIYPQYISSEAEGTCLAGEVVWMIEVQYSPEVNNAIDDEITWSEYS